MILLIIAYYSKANNEKIMDIRGLSSRHIWEYENGFHWFSDVSRMGKQLAQYDIYKKILDVPGDILELGVYKGASLIRFAAFRELLENSSSRKIYGFDSFSHFPIPSSTVSNDAVFVEDFVAHGGEPLTLSEIESVFKFKNFMNYELIQGNVIETIDSFLDDHPSIKISLLHLDMDVYEPTRYALEHLWPRLSVGGVLLIDDYSTVAGATQAVDEWLDQLESRPMLIKNPFYKVPCYVIKDKH